MTGYKTVSLRMKDFQEYLSAYIEQSLSTEIANIAGNVYANYNIINTIRGSLQQTINTYIHDITGDVNVVISSINNVSGSLDQVINTEISKIDGAVTDINNIQNFITADYAEVSTAIN
jgi:archaellum component FlaC